MPECPDFSPLLPCPVVALHPLGGGRNSRVFCLALADGRRLAGKAYFMSRQDRRDRLGVEYEGLRFLWQAGERAVPEPIACDPKRQLALYEFVEGEGAPSVIGGGDLEQAVSFLERLREHARHPEAVKLVPASAACLRLAVIDAIVEDRWQRLAAVPQDGDAARELAVFLRQEFQPAWQEIAAWHKVFCREHGLDREAMLTAAARTLSPSDFGFHNAVRRPDGRLVFVDFEYFGWDDPVKMTADFLLHPAMALDSAMKRRFADRMGEVFSDVPGFAARLAAAYPLLGLVWCLIMLNEFVADDLARRAFAGAVAAEGAEEKQRAQLGRARRRLAAIINEYKEFPYA